MMWKDVKGYEGLYEVNEAGEIKHINRKKPLTPKLTHGYMRVYMSKDNKMHTKYVHRIVAEAFVPNPNNLPLVYHKDNDRTNNRADNLEWSEKRLVIRKCAWCGKEMEAKKYNKIYCSDKCRASAKSKRDAERYAREHTKPKAENPPKKRKPTRPKMIDNLEWCRNYAENQKQETLRLLREGKI